MPREKYIKNIKRLDQKIKNYSSAISLLEQNRDKFYTNPKYRYGNKLEMNFNKKPSTIKEFEKINKEKAQLKKLEKENLKLKTLKRKNENLLFIENLRPKTGIGSRPKSKAKRRY